MNIQMRNSKGTTITELMVALAITGVAVAGLTELSFISAEWIDRFTNGADSNIASKRALELIGNDIRNASNFGDRFAEPDQFPPIFPATNNKLYSGALPSGNPNHFQMSDEIIFFQTPVCSKSGWPTSLPSNIDPLQRSNVDTVVYQLLPDNDAIKAGQGEFILQRTVFPGIHDSSIPNLQEKIQSSTPRTILTGIVGPINKTTGKVCIFQAIDQLMPLQASAFFSSVRNNSLARIAGLVLNIQIKRAQRANKNSTITTIRSEIMMRNREIAD